MITSMSDILCVTNRKLCREDFRSRIEKIAMAETAGIILREKDLSEGEYKVLAESVMNICKKYGAHCILHSFTGAAMELGCKSVHLPLHLLRSMPESEKKYFTTIGASCHSVEDAVEAERSGCTYITAGHVFDTDCKKGLPGRGLDFLREVCACVSIPVYGIGGIGSDNISLVRNAGASGGCVMSGVMVCEDVKKYLGEFGREI